MLTILVLLFLLVIFDIAAICWGFTSSDGPESEEWERRRQHAWLRECSETHSAQYIPGRCKLETVPVHPESQKLTDF